jgi:tRNA threonylcarbamoyladenosine modification (KEOPS) complex Cgi121 subunit
MIFGAKGLIDNKDIFIEKINKFSIKNNIDIQVFNADLIYGKNHLITSFNHAFRAWDRKNNTTNSLKMEILLYASGERQLKLAIPKMGIKSGFNNIAFILIKKQKSNIKISNYIVKELLNYLSLKRYDDILLGTEDTLLNFGLNKKEIKTVSTNNYEKLILEKVAIVDIIK